MELAVYLFTAGLCIFWSIKLYNDWFFSAHFDEGDTRRVLLLLIPATFFILILLSTWAASETFRLDIFVLIVYDVVIFLSFLAMIILERFVNKRKGFGISLSVYLLLSVIIVISTAIIRRFPLLLMKLTFYLGQLQSLSVIDSVLFSFEPESETDAMVSLVKKAVIAFFSYMPITIVRFIYFRRSQQRLRNEIKELRKRISAVEGIVNHE